MLSHVVVVVRLACFDDLWVYAVKAIRVCHRQREKPSREERGVYTVCMKGRASLPVSVCSSDLTVEVNQQWRKHQKRYPAGSQLGEVSYRIRYRYKAVKDTMLI